MAGLVRALAMVIGGVMNAHVAAAQDVSVSSDIVWSCYETSALDEGLPHCVGAAAEACQDDHGYDTVTIGACLAAETQAWDDLLNQIYRAVRP